MQTGWRDALNEPASSERSVRAAPPGALAASALACYRPMPGRMVMPDVCCDLVWSRGKLLLTGPMTSAMRSQNVGHDVILMQLDPLVARAWLRAPLIHFTNRMFALVDVAPPLAHMLDAHRYSGTIHRFVRPAGDVAQAGVDPRLVAAARMLKQGASVARVAEAIALSERQFERVFLEQLGLAPKTFARIVRFRRALTAAKNGLSFAAAAGTAGYADQAHFSRDVRKLTGNSPRALLPNVGNVQDFITTAV